MINKESIISLFNDKPTLLEWLKKVEAALKGASASSFKVNKRGDATLTFSIVFDDGSEIESEPITLQQGESVTSAAIRNGHLFLTLTNGDELDAGNMFNGDITLAGNFAAASVKTPSLTSAGGEIAAQKPVVEVMTGYTFAEGTTENIVYNTLYSSVCKNGNKLTFVYYGTITPSVNFDYTSNRIILATFTIPSFIGAKLFPYSQGSFDNVLDAKVINAFYGDVSNKRCKAYVLKWANTSINMNLTPLIDEGLVAGTTYIVRYEVTFLLSDNLAA